MRIQDKLVPYLEYCEYRKELDKNTISGVIFLNRLTAQPYRILSKRLNLG